MYISSVPVIFPFMVHVREKCPKTKSMFSPMCGEGICGLDFNRYVQGAFFSTGNHKEKNVHKRFLVPPLKFTMAEK